MLARAVTQRLLPFVLIMPLIYRVTLPNSVAPEHDRSFTQLFKLSVGITTAVSTPDVTLLPLS